jgi:hypothetical protein
MGGQWFFSTLIFQTLIVILMLLFVGISCLDNHVLYR